MSIASVGSLVPAVALIALLWPHLGVAASPTTPPTNFATEKEAQEHCPDDIVVWLDLSTRSYYYRGRQRYGVTKSGAYVCREEAKRARTGAAPGSK
jgi:hypothetical protein